EERRAVPIGPVPPAKLVQQRAPLGQGERRRGEPHGGPPPEAQRIPPQDARRRVEERVLARLGTGRRTIPPRKLVDGELVGDPGRGSPLGAGPEAVARQRPEGVEVDRAARRVVAASDL